MSIDDKVVSASFESSKFEKGVSSTIAAIDKLKHSLEFKDAGKGFDDIKTASAKVDLSHIGTSLDQITGKLGVFRLAAIGVLSNIATAAVQAGERFAKSFTLEPLMAGFAEYSVNLNAIQTILANTQAAGTNLKDVNAALDELNTYSDKTIYNFSQMAKNIGTFTAAGVDLETATGAIKGIANLAALSGSNADQAATAMYQLSQAISAGSVKLQDWNSVVNAGMGGTVFQRALAQTAEKVGTLKKGSVELRGAMKNVTINGEAFRQSLSTPGKASWLTSDVLTKTLKQFTGDLSDAELAAQGFNDAEIKSIQQTAKTAQHAATEVKTIKQVFDVAKETAGSGWAKTFQVIFGTFGEAKTTFTELSNAINGFINKSAEARNKVLGDWKKMGGRTVLIASIKDLFQNLGEILKPIKEAFRDIFPKKTGRDLFNLTLRFRELVDRIKPSPETIDNLRRTFKGFFAVLDIGKQIIVGIVHMFGKLFDASGAGEGGFLSFTASIGDFLVKIDEALKKGGAINKFFEGLGKVIGVPIKLIGKLIGVFTGLFSGFNSGGFSSQVDGISKSMSGLSGVMEKIINLWDSLLGKISGSPDAKIPPFVTQITDALQDLGVAIGKAAANLDFEPILQVIQTGLFAGMFLIFRRFLGKGAFTDQLGRVLGKNINKLGGGILKNISGSFKALEGSMKSIQQNIKAKTLKEIAIAVALLALSIVALSFIEPKKLTRAITAIGFAMGELLAAMAIMDKISKSSGFIKMPIIAASMILLAGAIDVLSVAVIALSLLSWEQLAKGLGAVAVLMASLVGASILLSKYSGSMVATSIGITLMAGAINVLSLAVIALGLMDPVNLAKGLGAIIVLLGALVGVSVLLSKYSHSLILAGIGITAIAAGINVLALAVHLLGTMDPENLAKGLGAVVIIMGALVAASILLSKYAGSMILAGAGLLAMSFSLAIIADVVEKLGGLSIKQLEKGLGALGVALAILAGGLYLMSESIGGAFALTVAATGLALLIPAIVLLGKQSWKQIIKGLVALAGALTVIGAAAVGASFILPALFGLGAALLLIGAGLALAGAGIFLISTGLSALVVAAPLGVGILIAALLEFEKAIPEIAINFIKGLLEIVNMIAEIAPKFVDAILKIIVTIVAVIIKAMPSIVKLFEVLIAAILKILHDKGPDIIKAGLELIINLLKGIRDNIKEILKGAGDVIVAFLRGLSTQVGKIVQAGFNFITDFIRGIFKGLSGMVVAAAKALIKFLNALADSIDKYEPQIIKAGARIGAAIITGLLKGLSDVFHLGKIKKKVLELGHKVIGWAKGVFKAFSPSLEFVDIGHNVVDGLTKGITDKEDEPAKATRNMANKVKKAAVEVLHPDIMKKVGENAIKGFAKGIHEGNVQSAFTDLYDALSASAKQARETIADEQKQLVELSKHPKKNAEAIKAVQNAIVKNQAVLAQAITGHIALTKTLSKEKVELTALVRDYNAVAQKLDDAKQALADATQTRNDAFTSISSQYGQLPDIDASKGTKQLDAYEEALKNSAEAVNTYHATLKKLRKLGLDDQTYQKLLSDGTVDQAFADQLLEGGKGAVTALNKLDIQLNIAANEFTKTATANLYDAGVAAAQGLVDGLTAKKSGLHDAFVKLANLMVKTIKDALKIKSPSEVFAEIGRFTVEGLANGLIESSKAVTDATQMISDDVMGAMRNSLDKISDAILGEIDLNPTITPILDLSEIQSGAKSLRGILDPMAAVAKMSLGQATAIASRQRVVSEDETAVVNPSETAISFVQHNTSPKALDNVEIYRQTRNVISQARSLALKGP